MAITAKCDMILALDANGWEETWYISVQAIEGALAPLRRLAVKRAGMLAPEVQIEALRVSDVAVERDSLAEGTQLFGVAGVGAADTPWQGWVSRWEAGSKYRRSFTSRGMPDAWIARDPNRAFQVDPTYKRAFDAFRKQILDDAFGMYALDRDDAGLTKQIIRVVRTDPSTATITTGVAHGFSAGNEVRIAGVKAVVDIFGRIKAPAGIFQINATPTNTTFEIATKLDPTYGYIAGGKAIKRIYGFQVITNGALVRVGKRDTGRRFFVTRGRA